ncbi:MAG TPA: YfiR family protein [Candidatus Hydrogenedentes bacterium]|nr:YfiR family protein [Candidatus Hydrogenedentota bacterium]
MAWSFGIVKSFVWSSVSGAGGRPLSALYDDWSSLHILYVDSSATEEFIKVDKTDYAKSPTLTLGDAATFAERGGVIQLSIVDNKSVISINVDAAERKKLDIDIRLLGVSDVIHDAS